MRNTALVIPSEVEGSLHESFKVTSRDPSAVARDDGFGGRYARARALHSQTISAQGSATG
jgi:hypothetical protein